MAKLLPVGVLALAACLFLGRLGERALWSEESRWAEIPREMLLSANYFSPTINGVSYYDKPLGSYWLVLAAAWLTGSLDETAARLPCAVAGLLGIALLMMLARRLYKPLTPNPSPPSGEGGNVCRPLTPSPSPPRGEGRIAALAGFILATSFSYVFFARNASADISNLTGILAALTLLVYFENRPAGAWVIGLWLIMAATSLTKGLLGFALPILVFGLDAFLKSGWKNLFARVPLTANPSPPRGEGGMVREWIGWLCERQRWLLNRWSVLAIPLGVLAFLAPFALSADGGSERGLALVYRENVQRFFTPHNHRGPIYLYAYVIFGLLAPWSALLPAALAQAHHACRTEGPAQRGDRFALVYFWATFLFFTLAASRRSYYLLPILPAGALLIARLLTVEREGLSTLARRLLGLGFGMVSIAVLLVGIVFVPTDWLPTGSWTAFPPPPALPLLASAWLACLAAGAFAWWRFTPQRVALAVGIVAVTSMTYVYLVALPAVEAYRDGKPFALRVKEKLGDDIVHLGLYRTRESLFYLDQREPIQEFDEPDSLRRSVEAG